MNKHKKWLGTVCFALMLTSAQGIGAQQVIFPQQEQAGEAVAKARRGSYVLKNDLLKAEYMQKDGKLLFAGCKAMNLLPGSDLFKITLGDGRQVASSEMKLQEVRVLKLKGNPKAAKGSLRLDGKALVATYSYGKLELTWKAVLRDGSHYLRTELEVTATEDVAMKNLIPMLYVVDNRAAGCDAPVEVGNTRGAVVMSDKLFAGLETPMGINTGAPVASEQDAADDGITPATTPIQGVWSRNVTLEKGNTWKVSAVVGLVAEGQPRRSFLAYSERERAVPWRAFPVYISWYELNIDRNNDREYTTNMNIDQCAEVVRQWKTNLYDKYGVSVNSYVWDDGWDTYGTWNFNKNFPTGFEEVDKVAREMGSGIGAWLGPVGGYGTSGTYRRDYWKDKGGMQLSNPAYYRVFHDACSSMIRKYDFRFFKYDGISAQFSSVGPDEGTTGEENAEGIIRMEEEMRRIRPDIFFNTTVGTWASPFWFHVTDAVWRQESDYAESGNNKSDRERWITYRDRLVYQNFVQNSPVCPINTLMTHGFILTKFGAVSKDMDYDGIVREMRCAFACGSGMVELYSDFELMNEIADPDGRKGALWKELADCITWQKKNEDVLPDIHWVGGNPWNGTESEVYGWASWNGEKATLALRNGANEQQTFTTTLRKALEIPAYIHTSIVLEKAFEQADLQGIPMGEPIDIDQELTFALPGSTVFVWDGLDEDE